MSCKINGLDVSAIKYGSQNITKVMKNGNVLWQKTSGGRGYVSVGANGTSYRLLDNATSWTELTGLPSNENIIDVKYGDGRFVCISERSVYKMGLNESSWTLIYTIPSSYTRYFASLVYGNGMFLIVGRGYESFASMYLPRTWRLFDDTDTVETCGYTGGTGNNVYFNKIVYGNPYPTDPGKYGMFIASRVFTDTSSTITKNVRLFAMTDSTSESKNTIEWTDIGILSDSQNTVSLAFYGASDSTSFIAASTGNNKTYRLSYSYPSWESSFTDISSTESPYLSSYKDIGYSEVMSGYDSCRLVGYDSSGSFMKTFYGTDGWEERVDISGQYLNKIAYDPFKLAWNKCSRSGSYQFLMFSTLSTDVTRFTYWSNPNYKVMPSLPSIQNEICYGWV